MRPWHLQRGECNVVLALRRGLGLQCQGAAVGVPDMRCQLLRGSRCNIVHALPIGENVGRRVNVIFKLHAAGPGLVQRGLAQPHGRL